MTVSPEVEELVKHAMRVGDFASEDEVLLAALHALDERRQTDPVKRRKPSESVSPLGMQLREIRAHYLAGGGDVLAPEQFDQEMAQRRGERNPGE
jgi:Spy/CpxP family protein refolding chaperone